MTRSREAIIATAHIGSYVYGIYGVAGDCDTLSTRETASYSNNGSDID